MAISYPLNMPTSPGIVSVTMSQSSAVSISESPWSYASEVQVHAGQRWIAQVTLPVMDRAEAEAWQCFLLRLNGMAGTFYLGDFLAPEPRGNWSGNPLVDGANQSGQVLNLKGLAVGATIETGDYFQIGQRLYKNISESTVVADGSGECSLDIFPRLRESPSDGQSIITYAPKGLFRMAENNYDIYSNYSFTYYEVSFSAIEAV
jgi:hypothetical protein